MKLILIVVLLTATLTWAEDKKPCYPLVDGKVKPAPTKIVTASPLLKITPQTYPEYRKHIATVNKTFESADTKPLKYGDRYEVSVALPRFMLLRTSEDGIHEMRGFGAESRYFRRKVVNGKVHWVGVEAPKDAKWKSDLSINPDEPKLPRINYKLKNREELKKEIAANVGEASKTVHSTERGGAATEGLTKAADYIVDMIDNKKDFTLDRLEELHSIVANGTIKTPNGDLGLGILRGSPIRCVKSETSEQEYVLADMRNTSVRMGEQQTMSYTAPQDVRSELQKLLDRINKVNVNTPPSEAADIYTQFLSIHPFIDGNGRTSRMLLQYMQVKMSAPVSRVSESAAFMAFYLKPKELTHLVFDTSSGAAAAKTSGSRQ